MELNANELTAELEKAADKIKGQVKSVTDPLDLRLKALEESAKNGGSVDPALKTEVKNLVDQYAVFTKSQEDFQKLVDDKLANLKSLRNEPKQKETFEQHVKAAFEAKGQDGDKSPIERIQSIVSGKSGKSEIDMSLKAAVDMSTAGDISGSYFAGYDQRPGIKIQPLFDPHLRALFPSNTTEKTTIRYARETAVIGGPGITAEGGLKPEMQFKFDIQSAEVRKIAGYFRLPEEMMDDIPYLMTYLMNRGMESLKNTEDDEILHGDGTGQHLTGLDSVATAFAAGTTLTTAPNEFDVFVTAKKQLRNKYMNPTHLLVNPEDYATMRLRKTTQNEPLFPYLADMGTITVDGSPIIQNTRVAIGTFYVMDARWIEIVDRMQANLRLYDQDRDNAIKNLITCVIEERLAMPIYRSECVIKSTFAAAITDLTS